MTSGVQRWVHSLDGVASSSMTMRSNSSLWRNVSSARWCEWPEERTRGHAQLGGQRADHPRVEALRGGARGGGVRDAHHGVEAEVARAAVQLEERLHVEPGALRFGGRRRVVEDQEPPVLLGVAQ